ncbi:MAG: hypothetical protein RL062_755, partial [Bacteroidota bacterium]
MKHFISFQKSLWVGLVLLGLKSNAQVSFGGEPFNWSDKHIPAEVNFIQTPGINLAELLAEDAVVDQVKSAPYRFGVEFDVNYNLENSGHWTFFPNEDLA